MSKRMNKTPWLIGGAVILQLGCILFGGNHSRQMTMAKNNNGQARNSQEVNTEKDKHIVNAGYYRANDMSNHVYGVYSHDIPPLNTTLRKYYDIKVLVKIQPEKVSQQFVIIPAKKGEKVPKKVSNQLKHSSLMQALRHYNVKGKVAKTLKNRGGHLVTFDHLRFDSAYNKSNEQKHFVQVNEPFVIPPQSTHQADADVTFVKNGLITNDLTFSKVSNQQAKAWLKQGLTNLSALGY